MKNKILGLFIGLASLSFVVAEEGYGMMGAEMLYGSGSYGMMGAGMGFFGGLTYLLVTVNLVFLAIFLYKKIWRK